MKSKIYAYMLTLGSMAVLLAGCGSGGTTPDQTKHALNESLTCIGCHEDPQNNPKWASPGTGKSVVAEWKTSTHNTNDGASCKSCHGNDFGNPTMHPLTCGKCHTVGGQTFADSSPNPDRHGRCAKCHDKTTPRPGQPDGYNLLTYSDPNIPAGSTTRFTHFSTGQHGNYVSTNYKQYCRKCHNPHDTAFGRDYRKEWANSGHGSTTSGFLTNSTDFKTRGSNLPAQDNFGNYCVRCHTSTGYVKFVKTDPRNGQTFSEVQALPDLDGTRSNYPQALSGSKTYQDKSREGINCNTCHDDGRTDDESAYSGRLRDIPAITIYLNFSATTVGHAKIQTNVLFSDLKASNRCIPCHSGRGVGSQINQLQLLGVDFGNINSPGAHDFPGAGLLTNKIGYEFAGKEYVTGVGANTGHDTSGLSSGKGPCITCHMNKAIKSESHTFKPVIHDTAQFPLYTTNRTWAQVYSVSNSNSFPASLQIAAITSLSCNTIGCHAGLSETNMNFDKECYISALAVLNKWARLVRNVPKSPQSTIGVPVYNAAKDSLTYPNAARSSTKWDYLGTGTGPDMMGSAFNLSMFNNEPGAYVHNPLYAKRLVYDSIYFLCTKATGPVLGVNQYPTTQQFNVADAIYYLITTTARTLETGPKYSGPGSTSATKALTTIEVIATIPTHQADAAILWLYGKPYASLTLADKLKRPGDN